jgi:hypothetical protein
MSSLALVLAVIAVQDTGLARLRHRADSLAREWRQASAFADLVDSLEGERAGAGRDTIAVGALRIVVNPSPLPWREAAARAWARIDSVYGAPAQDFARSPYLVSAYDPDTTVARAALHVGREVPWNTSAAALTQLLLTDLALPAPDSGLRRWLNGPLRPTPWSRENLGLVYVRMVTAPSQTARGCFVGRLESCRAALALDTAADSITAWYPNPGERRALVLDAFGDFFDHGASAPSFRACAAADDAACTTLLHSLRGDALPLPLGYDARAAVAHLALRLGGREAYARLLAHPDAPMAERLAAAAGVGVDSLLARWGTEVRAARPKPVALPAWAFWVALGWTLVFAGCGLRSSRWRLG